MPLTNGRVVAAAAALGLALGVAGVESHAGLMPDVEISLQASDGFDQTLSPIGAVVSGEVWNFQGSLGNGNFDLDYNFNADGGPEAPDGAFLGTGFSLVNTSDQTLEFTLRMTMNLNALAGAPVSYGGSSSWTLTGIDAVLSTLNGDPLWNAFINNDSVEMLFLDPYALSVASGSTSDSGNVGGAYGGSASSITLLMNFSLTAGDSLTHTGSFGLIPAPAAFAMFGIAGLAGRRRRRG